MGARSGPAARSLTTRIDSPSATAATASEPSRRSATRRPGCSAMHAPGRVQPPPRRPFPLEEALELLERDGGRVVAEQRRPRTEQHAERHHRPLTQVIHAGFVTCANR